MTDASPHQTESAEPAEGGPEPARGEGEDEAKSRPNQPPRWSEHQPEPAPWYVGRPGGGPRQPGWGVATPPQHPGHHTGGAPPWPPAAHGSQGPYGRPPAQPGWGPGPSRPQQPGDRQGGGRQAGPGGGPQNGAQQGGQGAQPGQGAQQGGQGAPPPGAGQGAQGGGQGGQSGQGAQGGQGAPGPQVRPPYGPPPQGPSGYPGPYGHPGPPAPWHDPDRYGPPQRPGRDDDPWQRSGQRRPEEAAPRGPLDLRTRWARGLAVGSVFCTGAAIWYSVSHFPTWLVGAGAGLVLGLIGLWLGVFAQRAAMARRERAPSAVTAIVWCSIASLISLMIIAFSLVFYTQLSHLSNCMRSATTIAAQNKCETDFENQFGGRG